MPITGFEVYRYTLPLVRPLPGMRPPMAVREGAVVRLTDEAGRAGWGEAAPLPGFSRATLAETVQALGTMKRNLVGWTIADTDLELDGALARWLDAQAMPAAARFAVEQATAYLLAAARGVTLPELFAPHPRCTVPLNGLLMGAPRTVLDEARRMRAAGYRAVKLKVGRLPLGQEVDLVRALAEVLGAGVALRLDANRAWSFDEAAAFADGTRACSYEYIEEPLADPARLPELASRRVPVALDETLVGLAPEALDAHTYARAVVLKPTLLGGLLPALRLGRRALALAMTPVVSAAFEAGLGMQALLALAATLGDRPVPAGLDTYRRLAADLFVPRLEVQGPEVDVAAVFSTPRTLNIDLLRPVDG